MSTPMRPRELRRIARQQAAPEATPAPPPEAPPTLADELFARRRARRVDIAVVCIASAITLAGLTAVVLGLLDMAGIL